MHASEVGLEHAWRDLPLGARSAAHALRQRLKGRFENSLQELENERKECEASGLSCQTSCEEGAPWETILRTAVSVNADLIAVGDPIGSIGLPERLLGSTAANEGLHTRLARTETSTQPDRRIGRGSDLNDVLVGDRGVDDA